MLASRSRVAAILVVIFAGLMLGGCAASVPTPEPDPTSVLDERPIEIVLPPGHDPAVPGPLLVALHGFGSDAAGLESAYRLGAAATAEGAVYVRPQGTENAQGARFWNAGAACCDFDESGVDDVAYVLAVIDAIADQMAIDRVVLFGFSNGGFLAHRLACEHPGRLAALAVVAGAFDAPAPDCGADGPAAVLHVHGTFDPVVPYAGGSLFGRPEITGATATVGAWVDGAGCGALEAGARFDLDTEVSDDETVPFEASCPEGRRVALWRVERGGHALEVGDDFGARVLGFALGR
ncbi:MAG: PHB depolymerase family esterase [Trueperaceae bacterium]